MNLLNTDLLTARNIAVVAAVMFFLLFVHAKFQHHKTKKASK
jgi:hypothetical protein